MSSISYCEAHTRTEDWYPERQNRIGHTWGPPRSTINVTRVLIRLSAWRKQPEETLRVRVSGSSNIDWLSENRAMVERHRGEWLLIDAGQLVVHDPDAGVIRSEIEKRTMHSPFVYYVPTDEEANFVAF